MNKQLKTSLNAGRKLLRRNLKFINRFNPKFAIKDDDFPSEIWLESTNHCNAACVMCPRELQTRSMGVMSMPLYEKLIKEMSAYSDEIQRLHMHNFGESLLVKNLPERIRFAKEHGIRHVYIVTNAYILNEKRARQLIDAGLDEIKISFYGTDTESYNSVMKRLDFDVTLENVKTFFKVRSEMKRSRPRVNIQLLPQAVDHESIEKWDAMFSELIDESAGDKLVKTPLLNFSDGRSYNRIDQMISEVCIYPWRSMVILQNGDVAPCCLDYDGKINLGSVKDQSIKEIWNGEPYRKLRKDFRNLEYADYPLCDKCDIPRGSYF